MVEELYTLHREALLRYCIVMCGDRVLSEDIVQNAFMRAIFHYEDLERLNEAQRRSWLYRTARNLFYDHVRRTAVSKDVAKINTGDDGVFKKIFSHDPDTKVINAAKYVM